MRLDQESNQCFVCGPGNAIGLKVAFAMDGERCVAEFTPDERHQGYRGLTHGGILFSLLDDVMANWLWLQGIRCFTARADVRYRAQLPIGTPVRLESRCEKRRGRLSQLVGTVSRIDDGTVVAEASASFMTPENP